MELNVAALIQASAGAYAQHSLMPIIESDHDNEIPFLLLVCSIFLHTQKHKMPLQWGSWEKEAEEKEREEE